MKRNVLVLVALAVLWIAPADLIAQTSSSRIQPLTAEGCTGERYPVQFGDVLYKKYGPEWERLLNTNPGLAVRVSKDKTSGVEIAWIYPSRGDILCIPEGMSVSEVISTATDQPIIETPAPTTDTADDKVAAALANVNTTLERLERERGETQQSSFNGLWLLIAIALAIITYLVYSEYQKREKEKRRQAAEDERLQQQTQAHEERERELRQNPVTSGPPMVAGGIRANETERLSNAFEAAAVTAYVRLNPGTDRSTVRVERIGPIEEGMIAGSGMVGYADLARPRTIDPPEVGYRARFRFLNDGREDDLMSLMGCMNPVYFGEGLSGFTFTPRQVVVPVPEPAAATPQAVPHPTIAIRAIRTAAQTEGHSTVTIGNRTLVAERGVHFSVDDTTGTVRIEGDAFSMTLEPKLKKQARKALTRGTGTDGN